MGLTLGQDESAGAGGQVTPADRNRALRNREPKLPDLPDQVPLEVSTKHC